MKRTNIHLTREDGSWVVYVWEGERSELKYFGD